MEEENQLPLKRVELSLSKFNDVAIPHHLELLRQHKANIIKYEARGSYAAVRGEAAGAARVAARLRALLAEQAALRERVRAADRAAFDARTQRARDLTLKAIMDYLESSPMSMKRAGAPDAGGGGVVGSAVSTESVGVVAHAHAARHEHDARHEHAARHEHDARGEDCDVPLLQLQLDERELALSSRETALRGWSALQAELVALRDVCAAVHAAAGAQRGAVERAEGLVDSAAVQVEHARGHLSSAEKLRAGAWGAGGAALGAALGGPVGLVLGAKAGAAALLAGSLLGYAGARLLGRRRRDQLAQPDPDPGERDKKTQ